MISSKQNIIASSPNAPCCGQPNNASKLFNFLSTKYTTKRKEMIDDRRRAKKIKPHPLENVIPNLSNHITIEEHMLSNFLIHGTKHTASFKIVSNDTFMK
jgi:hypothetical protein